MPATPPDADRILPPVLDCPTHDGTKPCFVMTTMAIHTVTLGAGTAYAMIVHDNPDRVIGACAVLNRAEVEAHIALLQRAIDDADRINAGMPAIAPIGTQTKH